jgi:hypothetical protein
LSDLQYSEPVRIRGGLGCVFPKQKRLGAAQEVDEMEAVRLGEMSTIVNQIPTLIAAQPAAAITMNVRMGTPSNWHTTLLRCSKKDSRVDVLQFLLPGKYADTALEL